MQEKESIIWFSVREEFPTPCKLFWRELGTASLPPKTVDIRDGISSLTLKQMMNPYMVIYNQLTASL